MMTMASRHNVWPGEFTRRRCRFGGTGLESELLMVSTGKVAKTGFSGFPAGWFNDSQLLFATQPASGNSGFAILDLNTDKSTPVDLGSLNGEVDPYASFFVTLAQ